MHSLYDTALSLFLFLISGCSDQKSQTESDKKEHFLRQQIDVMNDAKAVAQTLNQNTKAQEEKAKELTNH